MKRKPRPPRQPVITRERGIQMVIHGFLFAAVTAIGFWWFYVEGDEVSVKRARTVAFCVLAFSELFYALACRSRAHTLFEIGFFTNPALIAAFLVSALLQLSVVTLPYAGDVFEIATNFTNEWPVIIVLSFAPVTLIELAKIARSLMGWQISS